MSSVALKTFDIFNKKQTYNSVFTGQEYASKNWNCIVLMFLMSCNIYFCLVMHVLCSLHVLGLLSGLFWIFLRQGLAFLVKTGWQSWSHVIDLQWWRKAVILNIAAMMTHIVGGH